MEEVVNVEDGCHRTVEEALARGGGDLWIRKISHRSARVKINYKRHAVKMIMLRLYPSNNFVSFFPAYQEQKDQGNWECKQYLPRGHDNWIPHYFKRYRAKKIDMND
ncbi:hypothetical protein Fot_23902 [Forsythia ovata]|uniref:Uncharacterized protein n=1 Tax=Forsythia ovata TaxID=205694 RepID=A0ABD1U4Q4_9LAMI